MHACTRANHPPRRISAATKRHCSRRRVECYRGRADFRGRDASIAFHFAQVVSNTHAGTNVVGVFANTYSCSVGDGVRHTGAVHGEQQLRTANRGGSHIPIVSPMQLQMNFEIGKVEGHTMHTHPADAIRHVIVTAAVVHDGPVVAITNHNSTDSHMKISRIPQRCAGILVGPQCPAFNQINIVIDLNCTGLSNPCRARA